MTESILMLVLMLAIFYFMLIRPENKRKKANEEMRNNLKKGDTVTTIGGIVGTIVKVNASTIIVETSEDRVRLELTKWAVSSTGVQATEQAETKGIGSSQAKHYIDKLDRYRENYYKYHTGRQWKRVENYDLCLDSAAIGLDNCVELIKTVIELKFDGKAK